MLIYTVRWLHIPSGETGESEFHKVCNRAAMLDTINEWNWAPEWKYWLAPCVVGIEE